MNPRKILPAVAVLVAVALLPMGRALATTVWALGTTIKTTPVTPVELTLDLDEAEQLLLYGLGPELLNRGLVEWAIRNPKIELFRIERNGQRTLIDSNDNWQQHRTADDTARALRQLGATLSPLEAAMVLRVSAGRYVLVVQNAIPSGGGAAAGATTYTGTSTTPPPPPPSGGITPGAWRGSAGNYEVCFNVSADGRELTPLGSQCDDNNAFDVDFFSGMVGNCDDDDADADSNDPDIQIPIRNNTFTVALRIPGIFILPDIEYSVTGTFSNGVLTGAITKRVGSLSCTGDFMATPQ